MIELTPLARPYAKAVFDAALDLNKLDETAKDLFNISLAAKEEHLAKVINDGEVNAAAVASCYHYYYCQRVEKQFMSYDDTKLRMGEHIDSGNITFLNYGYGGYDSIPTEKFSIPEAKKYLNNIGIEIRL